MVNGQGLGIGLLRKILGELELVIMDLNNKAAKDIAKTVECLMNNIEDFKVEWIPSEDFKFEINYTIRPAHALRCIEINIPNYRARCLKGLRTRKRYFSFSNKWERWYDFDSRSKYIFKKLGN